MKYILTLLLFLLPVTTNATYFNFDPDLQLGVGLHFPSESDAPFVRPNLLVKSFLFTFAEDEFFSLIWGLKVLGLGGQVDTTGSLRPVISPVCMYMFNVCAGPDLIINQINKVDFGFSISIKF